MSRCLLCRVVIMVILIILLIPVGSARAQWVNGQAATQVIGQNDFVTGGTSITDSTLDMATFGDGGVLYDPQHAKLYVFDENNNRVLRFSYPSGGFSTNQPKAEAVLGQLNFASRSLTCDAQHMNAPVGGAILDDTLWVADNSNSRVIGFYNASTKTSGSAADVVLGQPNFDSNDNSFTTAAYMSNPTGVAIDPQTRDLYVCDDGNSRILKFNRNNKGSVAAADLVFGQPNFTAFTVGLTQNGLHYPWKVLVYKNNLFVADYSNGRVLRYNNIHSISSNQPNASVVFGQADFTTQVTGLSASLMNDPTGIAIDSSGRLYVTDWTNNRLLIFPDALTNSNTPSATVVLGQSDFVHNGLQSNSVGFYKPDEVTIDDVNKKIYVVDAGNNRVLQFTDGSGLPVELVSFKATLRGITIELSWKTATERENYGFEIEKAIKNYELGIKNWNNVGFVEGAGTVNAPREYTFRDAALNSGKYLYRLKQIDRNGAFVYSQEVEAVVSVIPARFELGQNFPNPFNPATVISYHVPAGQAGLPVNSVVTLRVYDILGREVSTIVNERKDAGVYSVRFDATGLASGVYMYRLQAGGFVETKKLVVEK